LRFNIGKGGGRKEGKAYLIFLIFAYGKPTSVREKKGKEGEKRRGKEGRVKRPIIISNQ